MPAKRETIYPEDLADRLGEYEKLLTYPAYGRWRTKRILKELDLNTTTNEDRRWILLLIWAEDPKRRIPEIIFQRVQMQACKLDADKRLFSSFAERLLEKRPQYLDQVLGLL